MLINFVIQNVEFSFIFAGIGEYNFNITDLTSLSTNSFPNASFLLDDNVQLSSSYDETNICSLLSKFARCVKYLLSLDGSINDNLFINASYIDFFIESSSKYMDG